MTLTYRKIQEAKKEENRKRIAKEIITTIGIILLAFFILPFWWLSACILL